MRDGCLVMPGKGLRAPHSRGEVHLIFTLADHFEPSIVPEDGRARAPIAEQDRRVHRWCSEYPPAVDHGATMKGAPLCTPTFIPPSSTTEV